MRLGGLAALSCDFMKPRSVLLPKFPRALFCARRVAGAGHPRAQPCHTQAAVPNQERVEGSG